MSEKREWNWDNVVAVCMTIVAVASILAVTSCEIANAPKRYLYKIELCKIQPASLKCIDR